ncbi:MFS transporter [Amycolatopsis rubida]|uniref:MFS transporter n=1 Tax=Amycolatopsis rubida TaxID=112413 RepID=A0ABX0BT47_9PSEU|nr:MULTISPECIES: isochorismatase family protein [Amycolatopsis]MYW93815.1 MFS transporter [Amycolatopsis rubida]NEC58804.1 MFS transporter [Amycolatopsis rubida]OAP19975.1 Isochorismatase family protein YecD [Amycolatopsis sp. M39]
MTAAAAAAPARSRFDRRLIVPMILGVVLNPVNSSMIAIALVPIGAAFGAPPAQTAWLVSGLYLATSVGQPVMGKLVDTYGVKPLYLAGAALTGAAGVLGTFAPSLGVLVAARVLLGFGTCAGYPAAMSLIRREGERTGVDKPAGILTALSVAGQTIAVLGPTAGGLLIGLGGWRAVFSVNMPLSLACLVLGTLLLPKAERSRTKAARFDVPGMVLFAGMLTALLLFLMNPHVKDLWVLGIALVAGALFAWRELRVAEPFIDLRLLGGNVPVLRTFLRTFLAYVVSYAFLYGYTQWLEEGRGLSASAAGLVLLPTFGFAIVVTTLTGRRPEVWRKLVVSGVFLTVCCGLLLFLDGSSPIWLLVVVGIVSGVPQGLTNLANQNALYFQADPARTGAYAGLLRTFVYLGAIVASSANGAFLTHGADTPGLRKLAVFMIVVAALFLLATLLDRQLRRLDARIGEEQHERKDISMALTTLDERTALVVIDLQQGIVSAPTVPHSGPEVLERSVRLAEAFRARSLPVVLVRATMAPDQSDWAPGRTDTPSRGAASRPEGWDRIVDELGPREGDIVVTKRNWGAFFGTDLDLQLRRRNVTQIVLTGVATSAGVESTARSAHEHGYHVTLATDAMSDLDADTHHHSITKIFPRLGETATTEEILTELEKTAGA